MCVQAGHMYTCIYSDDHFTQPQPQSKPHPHYLHPLRQPDDQSIPPFLPPPPPQPSHLPLHTNGELPEQLPVGCQLFEEGSGHRVEAAQDGKGHRPELANANEREADLKVYRYRWVTD
jgi:hypothetical protein